MCKDFEAFIEAFIEDFIYMFWSRDTYFLCGFFSVSRCPVYNPFVLHAACPSVQSLLFKSNQTKKLETNQKLQAMSGGPLPIWTKYTSRPTGIWEKIRQVFALVPNRSSGNPIVALYRNPPPGAQIGNLKKYKEAITIPAGDNRNNFYHRRDYRRNYPQVHGFNQTKLSGLLTLGSAASPRISIGNKGTQELATFTSDEKVYLSSTLAQVSPEVIKGEVLGPKGEPIVAPSLHKFEWRIVNEAELGMYTSDYPSRMFTNVKN